METDGKKLPQGPWLARLVRRTYCRCIMRRYSITVENREILDQVTGPALILSNHTHIIDYVFISSAFPFHIRWVAGAYLFKMPFLKTLLEKGVGAISKEQGKSDMASIMQIREILRGGDIVGVFPEGTRTWDGDTIKLPGFSLAKMIRYMKVPVLVLNLEGTYALKPRWIDQTARGPVFIKCRALLKPEDYMSMKPEELEVKLDDLLFFSNDAWQDRVRIPYESDTPAAGLQRVLYMCPKCSSIGTNHTEGDKIVCSHCHAETTIDLFGKLHSEEHRFETVRAWHLWEKAQLDGRNTKFEEEPGVLFQVGDINGYKTISKKISVSADEKAITVRCLNKPDNPFVFALDQIHSAAVNAKQTLEFFIGTTLYRIRLHKDCCSLKYSELVEAHQIRKQTAGR